MVAYVKRQQPLEQGTAPWQKPWKEGVGNLAHNPTTNARYKEFGLHHKAETIQDG